MPYEAEALSLDRRLTCRELDTGALSGFHNRAIGFR